jgi:hypothetical protein
MVTVFDAVRQGEDAHPTITILRFFPMRLRIYERLSLTTQISVSVPSGAAWAT